jgi:hypothetical protein
MGDVVAVGTAQSCCSAIPRSNPAASQTKDGFLQWLFSKEHQRKKVIKGLGSPQKRLNLYKLAAYTCCVEFLALPQLIGDHMA